ncbi:hypothetical protein LTSEURB_0500, partial [Salmonella enterica subsp. enterica serovar Urbana str. R8-2977]
MYGFYTNKSIDNIFSSWGKKIASINYKYNALNAVTAVI